MILDPRESREGEAAAATLINKIPFLFSMRRFGCVYTDKVGLHSSLAVRAVYESVISLLIFREGFFVILLTEYVNTTTAFGISRNSETDAVSTYRTMCPNRREPS